MEARSRVAYGKGVKTSCQFLLFLGLSFPFYFIPVCLHAVHLCECDCVCVPVCERERDSQHKALPLMCVTCLCLSQRWKLPAAAASLSGVIWPALAWPGYLRDAALLSIQPARPPASLAPAHSPSGKAEPLPLSRSFLEAQQSGWKTNQRTTGGQRRQR